MTGVEIREGIMIEFNIINGRNSEPRPGLYCVWIRAQESEKAPLISLWIDPPMGTFDSRARGIEPDLVASHGGARSALSQDGKA